MAVPTDEQGWVDYLSRQHDAELSELRSLNDEYELRSPRMYMHPEIMREIGDRLQQVVIAWPQLVVDALEERLDVEGFRLPSEADGDDDLWRVWQENGCDEGSQLAHIDALAMKRSYIAVGTNEDDEATPLVTFESPLEVYADIDPRRRKVRAALRRYSGTYSTALAMASESYSTLYLPDRTIFFETNDKGALVETDRDEHGLGEVPIVPLVNRSRLSDWRGRSELSPILPLAWAANKLATDMMVAAEFVAIPLRGIFGIGPDDLQDQNGNSMTALQAIMGRLLTLPIDDGNARQFEFTSANLSNFHEALDRLAQLVASLSGLPPAYLGQSTQNPPSGDAIRSSEIRLIKRAERRQRAFGGSHEAAMRLVRRFQDGGGPVDPDLKRLETIWRDPATPTVAQKADAAVKLYNLPVPIIPLKQTRQDLGKTDAEIKLMEAEDALAQAQQAAQFELSTAAEDASAPVDASGDQAQPAG